MNKAQLDLINDISRHLQYRMFNRKRTDELYEFLDLLRKSSLLEWRTGYPNKAGHDILIELHDGQIHKAECEYESADEYSPGFVYVDCSTYEVCGVEDIKRWAIIPQEEE